MRDGPSPQQLGSGCAVTVAFTNLGSHAIRVTVTDSFDATASDVHTIQVVKGGDTGSPCVAITSPTAGDALPSDCGGREATLVFTATAPDGARSDSQEVFVTFPPC